MPNHTCCVPGCRNRHTQTKGMGIRYYKFPKDKKIRRVWKTKVSREHTFSITDNTRVCSVHFVGGVKDENNPIPTIFPWKKSTSQTPIRMSTPKRSTVTSTLRKTVQDMQTTLAAESSTSSTQETLHSTLRQNVAPLQQCIEAPLQQCVEASDKAVQTESNGMFIYALLDHIEELENKNASLQSQLISQTFCIERFSDSDHDIAYYTGFPTYHTLATFWHYLEEKVDHLTYWRGQETNLSGTCTTTRVERKLKPMDEFFMCLMRLRLGLQTVDLGFRFGISPSSVSRIFTTWIKFLYFEFKAIDFQPTREQIDRDMPLCFKSKYPTTRLILDATEIPLETPSSLEMQSLTWSAYKNTNTVKGLIGITPAGYISFVSKLYCGNITDKSLTHESGVLNSLQAGDGLMADRGFDIADECVQLGIDLNIPPFRYGRGQLSASEVVETRRIASLRIHVERAINQIKRYRILESTIPISMTNTIDHVFYVCCMLTKFRPPLVS